MPVIQITNDVWGSRVYPGVVKKYATTFVEGATEVLLMDHVIDEAREYVRLLRKYRKTFVQVHEDAIEQEAIDRIASDALDFLRENTDALIEYVHLLEIDKPADAWYRAGGCYVKARNRMGGFGDSGLERNLSRRAEEFGSLYLMQGWEDKRFRISQ